ncbi:MAG: zinc ribbon domain-containing protein, partial [Betaproteobacteria bacterium]
MPIYEYRCSSCRHELESLQKFSDPPLKTCPACHTDNLVKLMSAAGFQLKGSGWYATDFKGGGKPAAKANGDQPAEAKAGAKTDGASEAKAETKTETKAEAKSE